MSSGIDLFGSFKSKANILLDRGDFVRGANLLRKLISNIKSWGIDVSDAQKADLYNSCGLSLKRSGDLLSAKQMYFQANHLSDFRDHIFLNNLAVCLFELGNYPLACHFYTRAIRKANEENSLLDVALYRANLGTLMMFWGKLREAQEHLLFSYKTFSSFCSPGNLAHSLFRLANCLFWLGYWQEAEQLAETAFRQMASGRSADDPRTAEIRLLYAKILLVRGNPFEAEAQIKTAFSAFQSKILPSSPLIGRGYLILAQYEFLQPTLSQKTFAYLKNAYRCFKATYDNFFNPDFADYYFLRAEVLMSLGQHQKATLFLNKSLKIRQRILMPSHPVFAEHSSRQGVCFFHLHELHSARRMYLMSFKRYRKIHPCHPCLQDLMGHLAAFFEGRKMAETCRKYSLYFALNKPCLVSETNPVKIVDTVKSKTEKSPDISQPKIWILLIATSDLKTLAEILRGRIQTMSTFYKPERVDINSHIFVQDLPSVSTCSFEELVAFNLKENCLCLVICLIGQVYGTFGDFGHSVLRAHPWMIHFRDRSQWDILSRYCFTRATTGLVFHCQNQIPKRDIQNPNWRTLSFLKEMQKEQRVNKKIEVRGFKQLASREAEFIMLKLNASAIRVINSLQKQ